MMKQITLFAAAALMCLSSYAQLKTPQPSPFSKVEQVVGMTDVTLEYSRPGMKNRKIFGDLVPFNTLWRTGANANTKLTFSDDVTIEGKPLKKGTYAMFTKPGAKNWTIYFYTDSSNWGTPKEWNESKVALMVDVEATQLPVNIETFMIHFGALTNNGAVLEILWDKTYVPIKIGVPTAEKAMASIESALSGPSGNDYYAAASYFMDEGKDLNKALTWINKAVELKGNDAFWILRKKSLIEAKLGKKTDAIATAKRSLASAEKAGNNDYVKMNKDSLKEWKG